MLGRAAASNLCWASHVGAGPHTVGPSFTAHWQLNRKWSASIGTLALPPQLAVFKPVVTVPVGFAVCFIGPFFPARARVSANLDRARLGACLCQRRPAFPGSTVGVGGPGGSGCFRQLSAANHTVSTSLASFTGRRRPHAQHPEVTRKAMALGCTLVGRQWWAVPLSRGKWNPVASAAFQVQMRQGEDGQLGCHW